MDLFRVQKDKWIKVLVLLVINKEERIRIGDTGRKTVVDRYSVDAALMKIFLVV
jgi:hypothetical protein